MGFVDLNYVQAEPLPESRQQGVFAFVRRGFTFVQGGLTLKFDKNSTNL